MSLNVLFFVEFVILVIVAVLVIAGAELMLVKLGKDFSKEDNDVFVFVAGILKIWGVGMIIVGIFLASAMAFKGIDMIMNVLNG